MDNILIYSNTASDLKETTKVVMDKLKAAGFTLNKEKCEFDKRKIKFIGHIFSEKSDEADPDKLEAIKPLKTPKNVTEVQRLMGMVNYVGKFIENLSDLRAVAQENSMALGG